MAIPASVGGWGGGGVKQTGIKLALFPSTSRGIPIELQQSTGSTLASSRWASIFLPPSTLGGSLQYTANLPLSTKRYYFRARHTGGGFSAGSFTPTVSARPVVIPDYPPPLTVNAAGNLEVVGADILISSANKPRVGSQNTTSYIVKTVRFQGTILRPSKSTYKFTSTSTPGILSIGATGTSGLYEATIPLPSGVVVTGVSYVGAKRTTAEISKLTVYATVQVNTTAGPILTAGALSTITMTTGTGTATRSTTISSTIAATRNLILRAALKTASSPALPDIEAIDVTYRMPSYNKTY